MAVFLHGVHVLLSTERSMTFSVSVPTRTACEKNEIEIRKDVTSTRKFKLHHPQFYSCCEIAIRCNAFPDVPSQVSELQGSSKDAQLQTKLY